MCFSTPATPPTPPPPSPAPTVQQAQESAQVQQASADTRRKAAAAAGYQSTIATGPLGLTAAPALGTKTLLGQ